jgi:hypothetical protein
MPRARKPRSARLSLTESGGTVTKLGRVRVNMLTVAANPTRIMQDLVSLPLELSVVVRVLVGTDCSG